MPVYDLTIARGGPKLHPVKDRTCIPGPTFTCGISTRQDIAVWSADAVNVRLGMLVDYLTTSTLDRPVIDKTGLIGMFYFHLEFTPEKLADADDAGPSIFAAVRQQLGLRLTPARGLVEVVVIDRVARPPEN